MDIDGSQINAIRHNDGPALVLAGPGSGKTLVITRRVQYLISERHVRPENILVITFTRAAAREMRERFERLFAGRRFPVTFGTFHSVYFSILRLAYGYNSSNIAGEEGRKEFTREYIRRLGMDFEDEADMVKDLLTEISLVKSSLIDIDSYYSSVCGEDVFRKIYRGYEEYLRKNRLLDFDDMLIYCRELFLKRPDILSKWQEKYQYILIDEFQDINALQYEIIRMLASPEDNLFAVGDDDQSIYRFRGASPSIMLHFRDVYPGAYIFDLSTNYRCAPDIVSASQKLISHNLDRYKKKIRSARQGEQEAIAKEFKDQRQQNAYIINEIKSLNEKGLSLDDMAVLSRTNSQLRLLISQLMDAGIPFVSRDKIPDIYDHWISRDIFTYIRLARGKKTRADILKIMNRPARYLSRAGLPEGEFSFAKWKEYYRDEDWICRRISKLEEDLKVIASMRPFSAVNYIRKAVPYEDYVKSFASERQADEDELFEVLDELLESTRGFASFEAWYEHIKKFREEINEQAKKEGREGVRLVTLHSSKGLEYDTVFIPDVCEKIMPYKKAVLIPDIEEERRMFYVGMTRAKNRLYILCPKEIYNKGTEPSRFIAECGVKILPAR